MAIGRNAVYANPVVDALIEQGRAEQDEIKRIAIYKEFQEKVVADAPDIFGVLERASWPCATMCRISNSPRRVQRGRGVWVVTALITGGVYRLAC